MTDETLGKYQLSDADLKRLREWHYHKPHGNQPDRYDTINEVTKMAARIMMRYCPPSRQLSLALTNLEQARMWANAAIACNEEETGR